MSSAEKSGPNQRGASARVASSLRAAFRHRAFTVIWIATVVSNIGTWMYNAASGWLMVSLNSDALLVSLVQVATSLPMFLFALAAGALADIFDKRRFLIGVEAGTTLLSAIFAAMVEFGHVTPGTLLLFMFLIGAGGALSAPAWQSVVPQLVPAQDLAPAVAANSVGINISRAVGPALAGTIIGLAGIAAPFWLNALSNLGVIGALLWWRAPLTGASRLPAERFASAMRMGFRHARHNPHLRATLIRAVAFFLFASAYWALLPLVARNQIAGGPALYGVLLGAIGAGAVGGAFALPWAKSRLGPDLMVVAATVGTAVSLVLFGLARVPIVALVASILAGASWIAVLANLNVSAQVALPDWVRGRGLAIFVTVFFGSMTLGSGVWGEIADIAGLPLTHFIAAAGALLAIPLTRRWKLQTGAGVDLTPSMHWPVPVVTHEIESDRGPVLVTVEYRLTSEKDRNAFLTALERLAHERRRDGAYAWGVFEDTAENGRFLETFLVESWIEHLRQHERVTHADRVLQEHIHRLLEHMPAVRHLISVEPDRNRAI
ncbi:MAG: MFS transporter [Steroidobacteraceae bacterium]